MAEITKNRTRYSTDDLLNLLNWFEDRMTRVAKVDQAHPWKQIWTHPDTISVSTISPSNVLAGKGVKMKANTRRYVGNSPNTYDVNDRASLKLVAPKNLPDDDDPGRTAIHAWKDKRGILPLSVTKDILRWYYSNGKMSYSDIQSHHETVMDLIEQTQEGGKHTVSNREPWSGLPPVYVDVRVADPTKANKTTPEEKIQRYKEMHGDPDCQMDGSSKTPCYHWRDRLRYAKQYYDKEKFRREEWRARAIGLGGECKPHMDFADYLIYAAKHLKKYGRLPK